MSALNRPTPALTLVKLDGSQVNYSWADYSRHSADIMKALYRRGIRKGDFIAVIPLNLPESFFVLLGAIALGAVPVPINAPLIKEPSQKDLKAILNDCKPKLVLANACLDEYLTDIEHISFEKLLSESASDDFALSGADWPNSKQLMIMPYTSGTTGGPKGVMLTQENIENRVKAITEELGTSPEERLLSYLSLGHISELIATLFGQLSVGYRVYFTEYAREIVRDRERFRRAFPTVLQTVKPTVFLAVPKVWINIRREIERKTRHIPLDLGRPGFFRDIIVNKIKKRLGFQETTRFVSAGSKLSPEDKQFFARLGIYIDDVYGQTETAGPLTLNGKPLGDVSVKMGKDDEMLVEGPNIMLGYFNNAEATAKVLDNGVFHTGDVGIIDEDLPPRVFYGGRLSDSFKLAQGEYITPEKIDELENEIRKISGVDETIVCGDGKPYLIALVFTSRSATELRNITRVGQGIYNIKKFLTVDPRELELTPTLKVRRKIMLKKFESQINSL